MAVTKKIEIDGQQVEFRASAAVPRLYRIKFGRDIYKDLRSLEKSVDDGNEESSDLDLFSLEMFENIAYSSAHSIGEICHLVCAMRKTQHCISAMSISLSVMRNSYAEAESVGLRVSSKTLRR